VALVVTVFVAMIFGVLGVVVVVVVAMVDIDNLAMIVAGAGPEAARRRQC
jgi:hypothetical protein